jgi:hypothetical protein
MDFGSYGWLEVGEEHPRSILERTMRKQCRSQGKRFILAGMPLSPILDQILTMSIDRFKNEIITMSRLHFESTRKLVLMGDWDYFQFVEMGLEHILLAMHSTGRMEPGNGHLSELDETFLNDYAQHLDDEVGLTLETLSDDMIVLVITSRDRDQQVNSGKHRPVREGAFILASANNPLMGEVQGVRSVDLAPTLLELGGLVLSTELAGQSILAGLSENLNPVLAEDEESLLREQLKGLGYI